MIPPGVLVTNASSMVAGRPRAGRRRWPRGAPLQPPVKDADHVLGPLAGREAAAFIEAGEPVVGILFPDDEECRPLLADGQFPAHFLGARREIRLHL
jgi:hypothetical protein